MLNFVMKIRFEAEILSFGYEKFGLQGDILSCKFK